MYLYHLLFALLLSGIEPIHVLDGETEPDRQQYAVFVDSRGVMRRDDNDKEVSYYGTNYTLPFAHAYRAEGYLGKDRKEAIRRDVAHMARLGFNGFRLHLWDSELADEKGNLLENDHLDLLDFLINELEKRGIDIILTAQTNFGNGYPEKDIDTGAFTYDFPKCGIHEDPEAKKIQENYLRQLVSHVNPYTGRSYSDDKGIIAIEINNEPCHETTPEVVREYINRMVRALKSGGFNRPILYNVSHNDSVREGYYQAEIDGTTYQWYPSGLVAGHERKGNFLPAVSDYNIPWKNSMPGYDRLARIVYEFDPGDILGSYLYPAIARTFRKEGFQWITQFAYDPTDLAPYNTEYQTHFLNLLYTPSKAISMLIAGEAARCLPRHSDFGSYPESNIFGPFSVNYEKDLSLMNTPDKLLYSNSTDAVPVTPDSIRHIAGVGSSQFVDYSGTGAYFLDKIKDDDVWRLEVLPDVTTILDPFEKTSLKKQVAALSFNNRPITLSIQDLTDNFVFKGINYGNTHEGRADSRTFTVYPGTYIIANDAKSLDSVDYASRINNIGMTEFSAQGLDKSETQLIPKILTPKFTKKGDDVEVLVEVPGSIQPDSLVIYPEGISFWRKDNDLITMTPSGFGRYTASLTADRPGKMRYRLVILKDGEAVTYPDATEGTPLDWDYIDSGWFSTEIVDSGTPLFLLNPDASPVMDVIAFDAAGKWPRYKLVDRSPIAPRHVALYPVEEKGSTTVMRAFVGDLICSFPFADTLDHLHIELDAPSHDLTLAILTRDGATYGAKLLAHDEESNETGKRRTFTIPFNQMHPLNTYMIPEAFPSFMIKEVSIDGNDKINPEEIEFIELRASDTGGKPISIYGVWTD